MTDTGVSLGIEKFLRQCLKEYPHIHSILLKQLVKTLADLPLVRCCQSYQQGNIKESVKLTISANKLYVRSNVTST